MAYTVPRFLLWRPQAATHSLPRQTLRSKHLQSPLTYSSPLPPSLHQLRCASTSAKILATRPIPAPTPWVPTVDVFLSLIGREMSQFAGKITSWDALFQLSSQQLAALGVEPVRKRRYLLWWRERFRLGIWGVGGAFKFVSPDGVAFVRTVQVPESEHVEMTTLSAPDSLAAFAITTTATTTTTTTEAAGKVQPVPQEARRLLTPLRNPGMRKIIVNVPPPMEKYEVPPTALPAMGAHLTELDVIGGKWYEPVKDGQGQWSRLLRQEGMWEQKQGTKKFGGERREKETRHKMRVAARRELREAEGL